MQVLDVRDSRLLIQRGRLVCDFCSSGLCFAFGFLPTVPRGSAVAVRLTVPPAGPVEDFHLQAGAPCRAHNPKKPAAWRVLFFSAGLKAPLRLSSPRKGTARRRFPGYRFDRRADRLERRPRPHLPSELARRTGLRSTAPGIRSREYQNSR